MPSTGPKSTPATRVSADEILAMIGPHELIAAGDIAAKRKGLRPKAALESLHRLVLRGELFYAGARKSSICGSTQRLFTRDARKAVATDAPPPYLGDGTEFAGRTDLPPIVHVLTPPVPKFRILRTQVVGVR